MAPTAGVTKWYTPGVAWVADVIWKVGELIEFVLKDDSDPTNPGSVSIVGKIHELKSAADARGQTVEVAFLASDTEWVEEDLAGKMQLVHLCTKKKCLVTADGLVHPSSWRRLTVGTIAKAAWLGDRMGDLTAQLQQGRLKGSIAASISGDNPSRQPKATSQGVRPPVDAADHGLASLLTSTQKRLTFGGPQKRMANGGLKELLKAIRPQALEGGDEYEDDDGDDGAGMEPLFGSKKDRLPIEIHETEPGRLYHEFLVKVNKAHKSRSGTEACVYAYVINTCKNNLKEKSGQRGLRELMTLGLALDSMTSFASKLQQAGFTEADVHGMTDLMKTGDILAQRFKVVEEVEMKIAAGKGKETPAEMWQTAQNLELIPNTEQGLMEPGERRAAAKFQKSVMGVLGSAG